MVFWVICSWQLKPSLTMMASVVVADGGEQDALAECLRDLVFVFFEAEGAGHAAAAGVEELDVGSGGAEDLHLVLHAHGGVVMAVAVDDDLLVDLRRAGSRARA